jgi:hypothetical protein
MTTQFSSKQCNGHVSAIALYACPICGPAQRQELADLEATTHEPSVGYTHSQIMQFIGWLTGDMPELHHTHPGKIQDSWDRFCKRMDIPRSSEPPGTELELLRARIGTIEIMSRSDNPTKAVRRIGELCREVLGYSAVTKSAESP